MEECKVYSRLKEVVTGNVKKFFLIWIAFVFVKQTDVIIITIIDNNLLSQQKGADIVIK